MKKTEFCRKLADDTYFPDHYDGDPRELVRIIIDKAIELGMLPPKTPSVHHGDGDYSGGERKWEIE
jgi:hypothetical protein